MKLLRGSDAFSIKDRVWRCPPPSILRAVGLPPSLLYVLVTLFVLAWLWIVVYRITHAAGTWRKSARYVWRRLLQPWRHHRIRGGGGGSSRHGVGGDQAALGVDAPLLALQLALVFGGIYVVGVCYAHIEQLNGDGAILEALHRQLTTCFRRFVCSLLGFLFLVVAEALARFTAGCSAMAFSLMASQPVATRIPACCCRKLVRALRKSPIAASPRPDKGGAEPEEAPFALDPTSHGGRSAVAAERISSSPVLLLALRVHRQ